MVRYPVGLETARRVRGYPTATCIYAGSGTPLSHGKQGYYGLKSNGDGTFTDALWNAAHYFFVDGEMDGEYYVDDPDGFMDEIVLSEAEFVARLLEIGGRRRRGRSRFKQQNQDIRLCAICLLSWRMAHFCT